jgi:hypothetical protein
MRAKLRKKMWSIVVVAGLLMPVAGGMAAHASTGAGSLVGSVPAALPAPQRINLPPGSTSVTFPTSLVRGVPQSYVLHILAQQQLLVTTDNDVATLDVLSPGGNLLPPTYEQPGNWEFSAPETGDYTLVFAGQGPLTPTITIPLAIPPLPAGVPGSISLPSARRRITIAPGAVSSTVTADLTSQVAQAYVVRASAGQRMILNASGDLSLQVYDPQGNRLTGVMVQPGPWPVTLPQDGDYSIALMGAGPVSLTVSIPPLAPATVPAPQRIAFAPGATSVTVKADLSQDVWQAYVLHVAVGQTMFIAAHGSASLNVLDPDGSSMAPLSFTPGQWQFGLPGVGDYTIMLLGQGPVTLTVTVPPLSTARNVTLADKDQTLTFQVGQSFLLFLGNDYTWNATADDPAVVSRVPDVFVIPGSQGFFQARQPGHTTLTATGDPACRQEQPPCVAPSMVFSVQIVVQ